MDLVVCDEAHKMSATFFGSEVKYTKRYRLGQLLGQLTRHLLLMTATPHNGKPEDFQLFMALLDSDRFEGRARDGVHTVDASDLMRRLVKEQLLKFDGTPLFPERRAYTVGYKLSDAEAALYKSVTDYVREEFNRADALDNEGRKGTVGFALTILQRRLASSPEAILQSLRRRRERLERRLREEQILKRGGALQDDQRLPSLTEEDIDELDDATDAEVEETEETVVDQATAARTIAELQAEIEILRNLEALALKVRRSGTDKKWEELSSILQNQAEMFDAHGHRRKMVIFSEHRDTLNYLTERLRALLGAPEALVTVHGGMGREERTKAQEAFKQDNRAPRTYAGYYQAINNYVPDYIRRIPLGKIAEATEAFDKVPRLRVHDARHSCATLLHAQKADGFTIQQVLGHSQLSTTRRYTHVDIAVTKPANTALESAFDGERKKQEEKRQQEQRRVAAAEAIQPPTTLVQ
jgi:hypothetical protein